MLLLVVELGFLEQSDVVLLKFCEHALYHLSVFRRILLVEPVDGLERALELLAALVGQAFAVSQAIERGYTHTEELIKIVAVDTKKRKTLEQGHLLLLGFLQNAVVEVHPTHVAIYVGCLLFHIII